MSKKRHRTLSSVAEPGSAEARQVPVDAYDAGPGLDEYGEPSELALSSALPAPGEEAVVRRTADGWRVGDDELPDLTCAMVLADLLAAELPTEIQPAVPPAPASTQTGPRAARATSRCSGSSAASTASAESMGVPSRSPRSSRPPSFPMPPTPDATTPREAPEAFTS